MIIRVAITMAVDDNESVSNNDDDDINESEIDNDGDD